MDENPQVDHRALSQVIAFLLGLSSLSLFAWGMARPVAPYFDETHYVPAARALIAHSGPVNIEHPLLAKTMIAAGVLIFGDNGLGWRISSVLFGAIAVVSMFWIALMMFRNIRVAALAALLLTFNQTLFVQARIAMLDMPMTALIMLGGGCLLKARQNPLFRQRWEVSGAVLLGLAIGCKWLAAPYAVLFLGATGWAKSLDCRHDLGEIIDEVIPASFKLGVIAALSYLVTFWPAFFYTHTPMTLGHLIPFQFEMLEVQSAPMSSHPYQSNWWQWPLMLRPIWYLFTKTGSSYEAILLIGNPVIYWGGIALLLAAIARGLTKPSIALNWAIAIYLFSLMIWIFIPKQIGFFYYYNLSAIALVLVITAFFASFGQRGMRVLGWFTTLAGLTFIYFYPIISALPLPADDTWTNWVWMKTWY
jgi:dolichyl-phosphate-mannose-protein mannosyltransferase